MPAGYSLSQLFPELTLAIGALVLLMLGAVRGEFLRAESRARAVGHHVFEQPSRGLGVAAAGERLRERPRGLRGATMADHVGAAQS